jgi:tryptophan synthase alpha chain
MCSIVAGDPHIEATARYLDLLAENGVDIIEVIYPVGEPIYHGPAIQRASRRALREDIDWEDIAWLAEQFREQQQLPLVLSSYYNRFLQRGLASTIEMLEASGFDSVMVNDLPLDESGPLLKVLEDTELSFWHPIAPSTPEQRVEKIAENTGEALVWTGHTGADLALETQDFANRMKHYRETLSKPIIASMKISTGDDAASVGAICDGVLIGSALMWVIESRGANLEEKLVELVREFRTSLDASRA